MPLLTGNPSKLSGLGTGIEYSWLDAPMAGLNTTQSHIVENTQLPLSLIVRQVNSYLKYMRMIVMNENIVFMNVINREG